MRTTSIVLLVLTATVLAPGARPAARGADKPDILTKELVARYFVIPQSGAWSPSTHAEDREAMAWLIAERARQSEEWRPLLARAREGCKLSIRILGLMLAREDAERRAVERWDEAMRKATTVPPGKRDPKQRSDIRDEVVPVLREIRELPGRHPGTVLALVRSRHPGLGDFYLRVLGGKGKSSRTESRFYAAAGLARLRVAAGTEWLKKHTGSELQMARRPAGAAARTLGACCRRLLDDPDAPFTEEATWHP